MELGLKEFKDIELEARDALISGMKIVMDATLMLENAEKMIKQLGGKTLKEEAKESKNKRDDTV